MAELLRLLLDVLKALCPVQRVRPWERGVWFVWERHWRTVGPGIWPVIPGLMEIWPVSIVPKPHRLGLQPVTLRDTRSLNFSATVTVCVDDPLKALCNVDHWEVSTLDLVAALLAEHLADVDPERFDPARGKRDRLLAELAEEADAETRRFGVRVQAIRFDGFTVGAETLRVLWEPAAHPPHAGV